VPLAPLGTGSGDAATREQAEGGDHDHGADHGDHDALDVETGHVGDLQDRAHQPAPYDRPDDPQDDRGDDAFLAAHEQVRDVPGDRTEDDPRDDAHDNLRTGTGAAWSSQTIARPAFAIADGSPTRTAQGPRPQQDRQPASERTLDDAGAPDRRSNLGAPAAPSASRRPETRRSMQPSLRRSPSGSHERHDEAAERGLSWVVGRGRS